MEGSEFDTFLRDLKKPTQLFNIRKQDFVAFCVDDKKIRSAAEDFINKCLSKKKSGLKRSSVALHKKEEGNKKYKEGKYEESLFLYTESIFNGSKNDKCLPLVYSNRSLVLQKMGYFLEALQDIDMALENGYPDDKLNMLIVRKAKCLVYLGEIEKAQELLGDALKKSNGQDHLIEQELRNIKDIKSEKTSKDESELPEIIGGENENFVQASKYLNVVYNKKKGRHVVANKDIQIGDVLFVEKPFAFAPVRGVCHNCCKHLIAPIPCWHCTEVSYCSPKCRDDFWERVHSYECGFYELLKSFGIGQFGLRVVLFASSSFEKLKEILSQIKEPIYEDGVVSYNSSGYDSVFNLVTNIEKLEISDLFQYVMAALLLSLYMKNHTNYLPKTSGENDLKLLTATITRHILQLIFNGFSIKNAFLEQIEASDEGVVENRVACGIYTSASMMNHSCEPSIIYSYHNSYLIVRASKMIKKGEEVFNCFGTLARRMRRAERQEILSKHYCFKCECTACLEPVDFQEKFDAFKCENCKGPSIQKCETGKSFICLDCGRPGEITQQLVEKKLLIESLLDEGEALVGKNDDLALRKFLESWSVGRKIYYKFNKNLIYAAYQAAMCLSRLKKFKECVTVLKCFILAAEEQFGSFSIELAQELKVLGDAITNYAETCEKNELREVALEGLSCYQKAEKIINLLLGSNYPTLRGIKNNMDILQTLLKKC